MDVSPASAPGLLHGWGQCLDIAGRRRSCHGSQSAATRKIAKCNQFTSHFITSLLARATAQEVK